MTRQEEPTAEETSQSGGGSRVCDNCIRQKVKCDQKRPTCTRCSKRRYVCSYSASRRRPGPVPGSKRAALRSASPIPSPSRSSASSDQRSSGLSNGRFQPAQPATNDAIPTLSSLFSNTRPSIPFSGISIASPESRASGSASGTHFSDTLDILPEEEELLLNKYFETLHHALPIFSKDKLALGLQGDRSFIGSPDLILTLLIVTAKLSGFQFASDRFNLDSRIDLTLSSVSLQEDMCGTSPTLDQYRKFCLLAWYEFHQFPGQQAWMRISKLTRIAYWMGLDRLDMLRRTSPDWISMSGDDFEDWRLMWWCVYCLDSYANLSSGTPYQIDESLVSTCLVKDRQGSHLVAAQTEGIRLPNQPDSLPGLIPAISSASQETASYNLHVLTTVAIRHVGRTMRLKELASERDFLAAIAQIKRRDATLRLALPSNFFNPRRNAFLGETYVAYHARLIMTLHIHMVGLLAALVSCRFLPEGETWLLSWQHCLEVCQDISATVEHWNGTYTLSVDPAITFITFTALILLELHRRFAGAESDLLSGIDHCENILLLHLEQFASFWTLSGLLILSFKSFRESLSGPLSYTQMKHILCQFESPLSPRWLQFMASVHEYLNVTS